MYTAIRPSGGVEDAVVPSMVPRTPSSPQSGLIEELRSIIESRIEEGEARRLGERLGRASLQQPIQRIVEALRWVFVGWRISSIVVTLRAMGLGGMQEIKTIQGITIDWETRHVAELMALLYFTPGGGLAQRRVAFEIIKTLQRARALQVIRHLSAIVLINDRVP